MLTDGDFVVWNNKLRLDDKEEVGVDIASLGELAHEDVVILHRIVITSKAFDLFLKENSLTQQVKHLLDSINHERHDSLAQVSSYIRKIITHAPIPEDIYETIFDYVEKSDAKKLSLTAYYFKDNKVIGKEKWDDLGGESVLVEQIRIAWAHLFSPEYLKTHSIHHENHHKFNVCLVVEPEVAYSLTGTVKSFGGHKAEYEIEAHSMVKIAINKHTEETVRENVPSGGNRTVLSHFDVKKLLSYIKSAEKAFYFPQTLTWGKVGNEFLVARVTPTADEQVFKDTYNSLIQNITVNPGITIGRLKVIDASRKVELVSNDEIIVLKTLNKDMLAAIKQAKGIIIEEEPHPEVVGMLKSFGIPTVIRKNNRMLYSTGDVVSLNATTGEIKRGSMLVS